MSNSLVTINLVVLNGEKYIRHCLDAILTQAYPHELIELNILDNGSADDTIDVIENSKFEFRNSNFPEINFIKNKINLGVWPGQEELLKHTNGKYIVALCVDVLMDKDFIKNAVEVMEKDEKIGAIQPKIYKFDTSLDIKNSRFQIPDSNVVDTCGFQIYRSRRIINIGHGEKDKGQFNQEKEVFAVEGAVPVFRSEAFKSLEVSGEITDHDYFWYGDDLDLAWRIRLFGWRQVFAPNVTAWHDRQTTKSVKKRWVDYFRRIPIRQQIQIRKRQLDWRNLRWTLVKNDYIINVLKDLPWIVSREVAVLGYAVLFEPEVLKEIPTFFRYLPRMLRKRREIMKRAIVEPKEIRTWLK